ncbi:hypothetical protein LIER_12430 [Lithospermum erythrorhizon]|uniref:Uncharacterized protein n=1 Tax=Lithospermum erythrorhizon TaxID=34254 RepID=A0AAV3PW55_LITER
MYQRLGIEHRFGLVYYPHITEQTVRRGDLVLRMFKANRAKDVNKINLKKEGSYRVKRVIWLGTYILEELLGNSIEHIWHGVYLKKYYV